MKSNRSVFLIPLAVILTALAILFIVGKLAGAGGIG
jgi:hypothetical protein